MPENNFAFIDTHNVYLALRDEGWTLDWKHFRLYLQRKYKVQTAYLFFGYLKTNQKFYDALEGMGYKIIFKEVIFQNGKAKGNIDAELVLQSMIDYPSYGKAIIVTNDGDFACLVRYLLQQNKLLELIAPNHKKCSLLLKKVKKGQIVSLTSLREKLSYKKWSRNP